METKINQTRMDRRSFLQASAAASAGLMLAPVGFSKAAANGDQINVAILGAGAQGQVLLDACLKMNDPNIRFQAVCDIWKEYNLKRVSNILNKYKHQNNAYVDYKEMLDKEKDLDAVIVATPDFWHAEHAIASLNKGLHVYCEKEMSNTLEGAKKMVEAAKATGKLLQIGHQRRSNPRYIHCHQKLLGEAKICGRLTTINGQWNRSAKPPLGFPAKLAIPENILNQHGFKSMEQFRNWRWFKGLGGGPIVDLGSHQIDIYSWFLGTNPRAVVANGGVDYYPKTECEWYDTVMAIYEYDTPQGVVRGFYQVLTTNSNQGYYETFMGDQATLCISESASRGAVYPEPNAPDWSNWVKAGYMNQPKKKDAAVEAGTDVRETVIPDAYEIPVSLEGKMYHQPHLENFFSAVRGQAKLNCPGEEAYATAVAVLKVNDAIEAQKRLEFKPEEFKI